MRINLLFSFIILFLLSLFTFTCTSNFDNDPLSVVDDGIGVSSSVAVPIIYTEDTEVANEGVFSSEVLPIGDAVLKLQLNAHYNSKRLLTKNEQRIIDDLTVLLRSRVRKVTVETVRGTLKYYADGVHFKTAVYEKYIYSRLDTGVELGRTSEWRYLSDVAAGVNFSVGNSVSSASTYSIVSVDFRKGQALDSHYSSLTLPAPSDNTYNDVVLAIKGIGGRIRLGSYSLTVSQAIKLGRFRMLSGEVIEGQYYSNTASDVAIPVSFDGNNISLEFYTEDSDDYDFNDSFVTVTLNKVTGQCDLVSRAPYNQTALIGSNYVTFKSNTEIIFRSDGSLSSGYLNGDHTLIVGDYNISFQDGTILRFSDDFVKLGTLSDNHTLTISNQNIDFKSNTEIIFRKDGSVWNGYLNGNQTLTVGSQSINFKNGTIVGFGDYNNVRRGYLNGHQTINGIHYTDGGRLDFSQDGSTVIHFAPANNNFLVGSNYVSFMNVNNPLFGVMFYNNGNVKWGQLDGNHTIHGITYLHGGYITFYQNGTVSNFGLNNTYLVGNQYVYLKPGSVNHYSNGTVSNGRLDGNQTLNIGGNNISFKNDTEIRCYSDGSVSSGKLYGDQTLSVGGQNVTFDSLIQFPFSVHEPLVSFYNNGSLKQGRLVGTQYLADTNGNIHGHYLYIRFNENGTVHSSGGIDNDF